MELRGECAPELLVLVREDRAEVEEHTAFGHAGHDAGITCTETFLQSSGVAADGESDRRNARGWKCAAADARLALDDPDVVRRRGVAELLEQHRCAISQRHCVYCQHREHRDLTARARRLAVER